MVLSRIRSIRQGFTTNPDGLSWQSAFPTFQQALAVAKPREEIWVGKGEYAATAEQSKRQRFAARRFRRITYLLYIRKIGFKKFEFNSSEIEISKLLPCTYNVRIKLKNEEIKSLKLIVVR